jgi:hypothetical protein
MNSNPKIAFCFFGQPRNLYQGYENIQNFIKKNNINPDFYYHTWLKKSENNEDLYYEASPYRNISKEELKIDPNIISKINNLYNPIDCENNEPIIFDLSKYEGTAGMEITKKSETLYKNSNNIISAFYSINKVKNILLRNNIQYDIVILLRFDCIFEIKIDLNNIDLHKIYSNNINSDRKLLEPRFIISNLDNFIKISSTYENLLNIINNNDIREKLKLFNCDISINAEELTLANFYYYYNNVDDIVEFTNLIPNPPW